MRHGQRDRFVPVQQSELPCEVLAATGTALMRLRQHEYGQRNELLSDPAVGSGAASRQPGRPPDLTPDTIPGFFRRLCARARHPG